MKIICVALNYTSHNDEIHKDKLTIKEPIIFMKSDISLLKDGNPFYIPNFSSEIQYETEIVIRIDRLGKNIARRFSHRYFKDVTIGIDITARDLQQRFRESGLPWELCKSFDNSAVVGTFIKIEELKCNINQLPFHLNINNNTVQKGNTSNMIFKVDEIIEYVSQFITLKIGDLIFTGTPVGTGNLNINDHLQGYIGDKMLLDFYVK
ncbi:fumarylacetoacetate hydrolase family protein [Candidatus Azobacteroides pseudotrichonymphae]|jgi:2-keto-4-pentenoate hydratase/2-oxohepta-3-ene-1,7-dioic acid hydratase in catechol pathway|uniref:2-hydroxyhepta-2,4-diene-1,7-dioate isomerase n=1 Tax=Azobacteroides pseudotrichonymphae genomovar. CFP2 TaxID=511995 RepID=B6YRV7_AZOPC|nr:fumarylacetoacetate hydrolase family protein [Candidatus Azobacteroides pseudotrichonymphae]BAG83929.1 putative 2-hydroxyhepta-2,4-diene-1,7-dioate isomerase [Candidatus Azobacteroides pseudotrichonymphae genomovar. CFP2]